MMHQTNTLMALMIAALALSSTACYGTGAAGSATDEASTPPRMVSGTITIVASEPGFADEIADTYHSGAAHSWYHACQGTGRYGDLREGRGSVVVRDGNGDTLGFDGLDSGYYQIFDTDGQQLDFRDVKDEPFDEHGEYRYYGRCLLNFYVGVPAKPADLYVVEVPHRGKLTYSHKELDDLNWHVDVTLE